MPFVPEDTPTEKILTEDGKLVGVGDRVYCYYDAKWGVIDRIEDTHGSANSRADNRNQVLWADVTCDDGSKGYYNGQRLSTHKPEGT